ncbi:protein of unknown function [Georgfuchsia toluolica]|uniref:Uncharacterized protein n=1 Tax=Georgfuchsia toluolica TaxID=424218 RepID=A0A916J5A0_9PROT|nr:protein of unknown function [Georgfuchsia toluolica]
MSISSNSCCTESVSLFYSKIANLHVYELDRLVSNDAQIECGSNIVIGNSCLCLEQPGYK